MESGFGGLWWRDLQLVAVERLCSDGGCRPLQPVFGVGLLGQRDVKVLLQLGGPLQLCTAVTARIMMPQFVCGPVSYRSRFNGTCELLLYTSGGILAAHF